MTTIVDLSNYRKPNDGWIPPTRRLMNDSISAYTDFAAQYEEHNKGKMEEIFKDFLTFLPETCKVLDAGCGPGRDLKRFLDSGFDAVGLDLNPSFAAMAGRFGTVYQSSILDMPFEGSSFDAAWCSASLVHMDLTTMTQALQELHRVLKKGSWVYISVKHRGPGMPEAEWKYTDHGKRWFYYWSMILFANKLEYNGFSVKEIWIENGFVNVYASTKGRADGNYSLPSAVGIHGMQ